MRGGFTGGPAGSLRGGSASRSRPNAMQSIALNLASKSYSKMHDAGRFADPSVDPSVRARNMFSPPATPANSMHSR